MQVGDRVVHKVNEFTPEQLDSLKEQAYLTKHLNKSGRVPTTAYKSKADHGTVLSVEKDGYYLVAVELGDRVRTRRVIERELCLEKDYDPARLVKPPV